MEIFGESGFCKEKFDITTLTVADDIKRILCGQNLQGFFQILIERCTGNMKKCMFCLAAAIDQAKLFILRILGKDQSCNFCQGLSEKCFELTSCDGKVYLFFLPEIISSGFCNDICRVPQSTVYVKNDTVHSTNPFDKFI